MDSKRIKSLLGSSDEQFFFNTLPDPVADLTGAGRSLPLRASDWWLMCELWNYPYYTLSIMLEGAAGTFRHESGFECELAYGHFFLTNPHYKQHYGPGRGQCWSELYIGFQGTVIDAYFAGGVIPWEPPVWFLENPAPWIKRLQTLVDAPRPTTRFEVMSASSQFLSVLFDMLAAATPVVANQAGSDWFAQACRMLTADMQQKADLKQIAGVLGMSYHTFRRYFTRRAGMPPARYREEQRLKIACAALRDNPHKSCQQIAFALGYNNGDHFSAYFKKHLGLSPRAYRKQHSRQPAQDND